MIQVVAGILLEDGKVLIARRAPHKKLAGKWEFPGGKVKDFEDHATALERELQEELGIKTKTRNYFCSNVHDYGDFEIRLIVYFSDYIEGKYELNDHDMIEWIEIKELKKLDLASADIPVIEKLMKKFL